METQRFTIATGPDQLGQTSTTLLGSYPSTSYFVTPHSAPEFLRWMGSGWFKTEAVDTPNTGRAPKATAVAYGPRISRSVWFNRVPLTPSLLDDFEMISGNRLPDGRYWYDRVSGLWGREGAGPFGTTQPGLEWGASLREDASR